jgi:hypothetical protein
MELGGKTFAPPHLPHMFGTLGVNFCPIYPIYPTIQTGPMPPNIQQYRQWIQNLIPNGKAFHHFGFAAVSWVLWKRRNKVVFEKKINQAPC